MELGYPGGRVIDQLAKGGNPRAVPFPRARLKKVSYDFSFSGLKTAVWHYLKAKEKNLWQDQKADIAASFQEAVVDMLIAPTLRAANDLRVRRIVLAGGVAANSRLREKMKRATDENGIEVHFPSPAFCTDNGAMVALCGYHWLKRGRRDDFRLNADADLTLR
jgi:N6-L-threonylcarbamoyladenine synthase